MVNRFGDGLAALFDQMGYTEDSQCTYVSGKDFDRVFGLPSIRIQAFLDWFQTCLSPSQSLRRVLSAEDYEFYKTKMKDDGYSWLLSGDALSREERLCAHEERDDQGLALEALNSRNLTLEKQISALENSVETISARNTSLERCIENEINLIANLQSHDVNMMEQSLSRTSTNESLQIEKLCHTIENQVDDFVSLLSPSSDSIDHQSPTKYQQQPQSSEQASIQEAGPSFVYRMSLENLLSLEDTKMVKMMKQVRAMQENQQNASDQMKQASPMDTEEFPKWLLEADPAKLSLQEHHVAVYNQLRDLICPLSIKLSKIAYYRCSIELARLESALAVGKIDRFRAQIELLTNTAYLEELSMLPYRKMQLKLLDPQRVDYRIRSTEAFVRETRHNLAHLATVLIPQRCRELAALECSSVVLETYRHRIYRQQNCLQEFDSILSSYEQQHHRLNLLHSVLTGESSDLQGFYKLISESFAELDHSCQRVQDKFTAALCTQPPYEQMPNLSEHATFLQSFRQVLEGNVYGGQESTSQQSGRSDSLVVEELLRLSQIQQANAISLHQSWIRILDEWQRLATIKQDVYHTLRVEMFGDSHSWTPQLLSKETHNALQRATDTMEVLEKTFYKAIQRYEAEKRNKNCRNGTVHDKMIKIQCQIELLSSKEE
uniref:AlNc14C78G5170 protein n=1 Tax=Albugo laibachii Nc14 TaxID=890382 RepID=F0WEX2_9STRA|nr:AlNc14C78G5170 [Albugo laibachii Nc14]|eukprot:CCA19754.1 AlNc14C78G5170 [Albugo laibachii Nc14]